jgi:subtilisin-like proprotein convertase family protein
MKISSKSLMYIFTIFLLKAVTVNSDIQAQMYWNQSAQFPGNSSSYVSVPNSSSLNLTGSFSIEAWVNPANTNNKGVISKGGALGTSLKYAMRITSSRVSLITNGAARISSKTTSLVPLNAWTHIAATYNSASGQFKIYINGLSDTSATVAGAAPTTNTDSLFIGISGNSTPFNGQIDEVRLWNRELSATEVTQYMRTTLGTSSGIYSGLVMSIAFQGENTSADLFKDMSGNNNNANERNVLTTSPFNNLAGGTFFRPLHTISQNECIELDGNEDYLAAKDTSTVSPDTAITLECWVYPRNIQGCRLISKGNNYAMIYSGGNFNASINGVTQNSGVTLPLNQWSYIAFTYRSSGAYNFYVNRNNVKTGSVSPANINVTADSLYVGGGQGAIGDLNGYLDEVRITNKAKTQEEISKFMYASLDKLHDPNAIQKNISYGFDGNTFDNTGDGGPKLLLRNNARFTHPGQTVNQPVSPLNQDEGLNFSKGFYIKTANKRIPETGTSGSVSDSQNVNLNEQISDINLFVSINHTKSSDIDIVLIAPNGDSVTVFGNKSTNSLDNNIITTFDDNADSSLINGRYASFYAKIKPENGMNSVFNGDNSKGFWKIRIRDEVNSNTGILYGWGLQVNDQQIRSKNLNISCLIQGMYDPSSNLLIPDTLTVRLFRSGVLQGTGKGLIGSDGSCFISYTSDGSVNNDNTFYIQALHRNSISVYSNINFKFTDSEASLDFITSSNQVIGNNIIPVDISPIRFALYSGDVNQDETIDASDLSAVENDAAASLSGYVNTDVTGDDFVDGADLSIVENNLGISVSEP